MLVKEKFSKSSFWKKIISRHICSWIKGINSKLADETSGNNIETWYLGLWIYDVLFAIFTSLLYWGPNPRLLYEDYQHPHQQINHPKENNIQKTSFLNFISRDESNNLPSKRLLFVFWKNLRLLRYNVHILTHISAINYICAFLIQFLLMFLHFRPRAISNNLYPVTVVCSKHFVIFWSSSKSRDTSARCLYCCTRSGNTN